MSEEVPIVAHLTELEQLFRKAHELRTNGSLCQMP